MVRKTCAGGTFSLLVSDLSGHQVFPRENASPHIHYRAALSIGIRWLCPLRQALISNDVRAVSTYAREEFMSEQHAALLKKARPLKTRIAQAGM
jgi:hypothetical protein